MKHKNLLLIFACAILGGVSLALGQAKSNSPVALTLETAIQQALKKNESMLIANNEIRLAGARIREAWAEALPQINFAGIYTRNFKQPVFFFPDPLTGEQMPFRIGSKNAYVLSLTVDQPLFQSGKVTGGIKAANLYKKFSRAGFETVKGDIILAVKQAYFTVQLDEELLLINQQSLDQQLANLVNTRLLFREGQVSELDTLRAWVDYTNMQPTVIRAENELRVAENRLKELVGLELHEEITLQTELDFEQTNGVSLEDLETESLRNQPELQQLQHQAGMLEQNLAITRADLLPKLYLSGEYQSVAQSDLFNLGPGFQSSLSGSVRLEVPIFNGLRNVAKLQQASLDLKNARHQIQQFRDNLRIDVASIALRIKEAEKRVQVQQHGIRQAERAMFMAERRYKEGAGTLLELGDALLALNLSKTNYVQAVYDHKMAVAELHKTIGRN